MNKITTDKIIEMVENLQKVERPSGYVLLPDINGFKVYEVDAKTLEVLMKLDLKNAENLINPKL